MPVVMDGKNVLQFAYAWGGHGRSTIVNNFGDTLGG